MFIYGGIIMNNSLRMFLLVTEEMSFTKAAKKAFVTQQCISDHIKRLEDTYGVTLFHRKPRLALTPAGEAMLRTLRQIHILENGMKNELKEIQGGTQGSLSFGINSTRGRILIPKLFPRYNQLFPNVDVSVHSDDTHNMEEMLLKGKINLFMGVNATRNPLFHRTHLTQDKVYLIISDGILKRHFPDSFPYCKEQFREGADLNLFQNVPMVRNLQFSTLTNLIDQHINKYDIRLNTVLSISDYDTQIALCKSGTTAAFCPAMMLQQVIAKNQLYQPKEPINIFPIKGFEKTLRIDLVYHKNAYYPFYIKKFIELVQQEVDGFLHILEEHLQ